MLRVAITDVLDQHTAGADAGSDRVTANATGDRANAEASGDRAKADPREDRAAADGGSVTVEAALALVTLVLVLGASLSGVGALLAQLRAADGAREAARLAGRGDEQGARAAVTALAGAEADLALGGDAASVTATVTGPALGGLLPEIRLTATAVAARERVTAPPP